MRPVLAPDAFVRTYVDRERGVGWVVVRRTRGRRVSIGATARALLSLADGTRELAQLAQLAGARLGRVIVRSHAEEELAPLIEAGAVIDATQGFSEAPVEIAPGLVLGRLDEAQARAMRVAVPPGLGTGCDGRGACCRLYDRIHLSAEDVAHVHEAFPDGYTPGGLTVESAIRLERDDQGDEIYALAVVEGDCVMLEADGRCGVHRRAGEEKKPRGCQSYPLRDVLCEEELAVGVSVECRCIVDFADGPSIAGLAEEVRALRAARGVVEMVADTVPMAGLRRITRGEYRGWRAASGERLGAADDVMAWAFAEAARLVGATPWPATVLLGKLGILLERLAEHLDQEAADTARSYAPSDLQRQLFAWAAAAAERLRRASGEGRGEGAPQEGERLLALQQLHTHGLLRSCTLVTGLVALGLRLALARAGGGVALPRELTPVSVVEYLHRAHGLNELVDEGASWIEDALVGRAGDPSPTTTISSGDDQE